MPKSTVRKVSVMAITKARINLGAVVRSVHMNREYVILEKGGIPIAGIMGADEFEDYLEVHDPEAQEQIRKSSEEYRAGKSRPAGEFLAELRREKPAKLKPRRVAK